MKKKQRTQDNKYNMGCDRFISDGKRGVLIVDETYIVMNDISITKVEIENRTKYASDEYNTTTGIPSSLLMEVNLSFQFTKGKVETDKIDSSIIREMGREMVVLLLEERVKENSGT